MDWLRDVVKNRGVLRMLDEIINEDFPSSQVGNLNQAAGKESTLEEPNEHFCSEHCSLFPGTVLHDPMASMGGLEGEYEGFDDSFIFPSLFGSAEF